MIRKKLPVSIIVPCRNEAKNLEILLPQLESIGEELIVVDGHSQDNTKELAMRYSTKFVLDNGKGKGDGIRVGIAHATKDICVFLDADLSHDPLDIPKMVEPILTGKADIVLGSRMRGGGDEFIATPLMLIRLFGNMGLTWLINLRCNSALSDSQNGFRAIKTSLLRSIKLISNRHTIELEMIMRALRFGARVVEVPAHEYPRRFGDSSLSLIEQGFLFLFVYIRECFRPL
ncbi:MAG: glycosyltransferase family 2 protein [Candidatus Omnitrophota bacterium]